MLPPTVRPDGVIVRLVVSLDGPRQRRSDPRGPGAAHIDDGHHICGRVAEFAEVDVKVGELVPFGLAQDVSGPFAHGVNAAQVCGGVQLRIGRSR